MCIRYVGSVGALKLLMQEDGKQRQIRRSKQARCSIHFPINEATALSPTYRKGLLASRRPDRLKSSLALHLAALKNETVEMYLRSEASRRDAFQGLRDGGTPQGWAAGLAYTVKPPAERQESDYSDYDSSALPRIRVSFCLRWRIDHPPQILYQWASALHGHAMNIRMPSLHVPTRPDHSPRKSPFYKVSTAARYRVLAIVTR